MQYTIHNKLCTDTTFILALKLEHILNYMNPACYKCSQSKDPWEPLVDTYAFLWSQMKWHSTCVWSSTPLIKDSRQNAKAFFLLFDYKLNLFFQMAGREWSWPNSYWKEGHSRNKEKSPQGTDTMKREIRILEREYFSCV